MDKLNSPNSLNSFSVVPPISECGREKSFLNKMNQWIQEELSKVDSEDSEQRYHVHKEAFGKTIEHLGIYKPLLNRIKVEYEDCIDTVRDGQHEAFFLEGKLSEIANAPTALQNYRKRKEELENKLSIIETDNNRLRTELTELRSQRIAKDAKDQEPSTASNAKTENAEQSGGKGKGPVPGLTIEQATDCDLLQQRLEKSEQEYRDLSLSYQNRYSQKSLETDLRECLAANVIHKDQLGGEIEQLKQNQLKLIVAVQAAHAYLKIQPPYETIGVAVVTALSRDSNSIDSVNGAAHRMTPSTLIEEEDIPDESQTEALLDYIEKFNELLENKMYSEAALHAANSIKGILRTPETMQRFKDLTGGRLSGDSPLLLFCEALMSTVPSFGTRPDKLMSEECVRCALNEKRLDLLMHWVSKDRLTVSVNMADMIFNFSARNGHLDVSSCLSLAQKIYVDVLFHVSAMVCMVKQKRVKQALEYAESKACSTDDVIQVLDRCPDLQLANALFGFGNLDHLTSKSRLPVGVILTVLFNSQSPENGLIFLQDIYSRLGKTALKKAVTDDKVTSMEQWNVVVERCRQIGGHQLADTISLLLPT